VVVDVDEVEAVELLALETGEEETVVLAWVVVEVLDVVGTPAATTAVRGRSVTEAPAALTATYATAVVIPVATTQRTIIATRRTGISWLAAFRIVSTDHQERLKTPDARRQTGLVARGSRLVAAKP
jgi:hypothetical protein